MLSRNTKQLFCIDYNGDKPGGKQFIAAFKKGGTK
jgi:hypothetical protein